MDLVALGLYDDSVIIDDVISITLVDSATAASMTVINVLMRQTMLSEFTLEPAMLELQSVTFHVWAENLPAGFVPSKGSDVVLLSGARYHVDRVTTCDQQRRFSLGGILERNP